VYIDNPFHTWREEILPAPDHIAMSGVPDSEAQKAMGGRLQAIREALDLTQEEMAKHMGVVVTTLSGWEVGRNQIDIVKLAKSATRWGFTTDWVARGDLSGLRKDLADKLEAMATTEAPPRRGRPKGTGPKARRQTDLAEDPPRPFRGEGRAARKQAEAGCEENVVPLTVSR
jgi:transcriptional regulator with XRE-family HTH domain